jgi:hypothetical protein
MSDNNIKLMQRVKRRLNHTRKLWYRKSLEKMVISRKEFIEDIKQSIEGNIGYATGKIGLSQKYWMYYEIFLKKSRNNKEPLTSFEEKLKFHGLKQAGIFPEDPRFYLEFNKNFYMDHIMNLDSLGIFIQDDMWNIEYEYEIIKFYKIRNSVKLIYYVNQEPDRSIPNNDDECYLKYMKGKKILIICPFGELLKKRAKREIFEGVWSSSGKKWFYPESVDAIEFPYGFSNQTQKKYKTAIDLFNSITEQIDKKNFDIALIAASGLAIPLASYVKTMGKVGIDLGGHLQIIFGVLGQRWKNNENFQGYFNDCWVEMPDQYKPNKSEVGDYDYW